ncbi:MAG: YbgA family protein [Gammaproteobacteria bacterium]
MEKILVGISSCLLGHLVRYDGAHKYHSYIDGTLGQYFQFLPFCPEVEAGLGVPRPAVQLREIGSEIRVVGVKDHHFDVTEVLSRASEQQSSSLQNLSGYILKKDSPSCGMERVRVYRREAAVRNGVGVFAARLLQRFPTLPVEEEGRLGDPALRENFVQRVFVRHRWQQLVKKGLTVHELMTFHSRHKLIAMSHDQNQAKALGRLIADAKQDNLDDIARQYILDLTTCLKTVASRGNHVNVLQHIQGYLKTRLDHDDKQELIEIIENYRKGIVPLIVPLTLLRHHFRKQPDQFIEDSYYMKPHPAELSLLNEI